MQRDFSELIPRTWRNGNYCLLISDCGIEFFFCSKAIHFLLSSSVFTSIEKVVYAYVVS